MANEASCYTCYCRNENPIQQQERPSRPFWSSCDGVESSLMVRELFLCIVVDWMGENRVLVGRRVHLRDCLRQIFMGGVLFRSLHRKAGTLQDDTTSEESAGASAAYWPRGSNRL
jgi:hypothetical protein